MKPECRPARGRDATAWRSYCIVLMRAGARNCKLVSEARRRAVPARVSDPADGRAGRGFYARDADLEAKVFTEIDFAHLGIVQHGLGGSGGDNVPLANDVCGLAYVQGLADVVISNQYPDAAVL